MNLLIEQEVGGSLRWGWLAVPLGLLVAAVLAISAATDRDRGRRIPLREKLADAPSMLLGVGRGRARAASGIGVDVRRGARRP